MKRPTIGCIVHYQSDITPGGELNSLPRAAIITEVGWEGKRVGLCVLTPTGMYFVRDVLRSLEPKAGYWNWPPRTKEEGSGA